LDLDEPGVLVRADDLAGKHILGAVKTGFRRDGIAGTCVRSACASHPADRQDKQPLQILHGTPSSDVTMSGPHRASSERLTGAGHWLAAERRLAFAATCSRNRVSAQNERATPRVKRALDRSRSLACCRKAPGIGRDLFAKSVDDIEGRRAGQQACV